MNLAPRLRGVAVGLFGLLTAGMAQSPRPALPQLPDLSPDSGAKPPAEPLVQQDTRSDKPLLVPTRDVAVTWTVQPIAGGSPIELTENFSVTQAKKRDNFPGGNYWITDLAQDRIQIVFPARRLFYATSGALRFSTPLPKETSFQRGPTDTIAGVSCTQWHITAVDGYRADACLTDDGVPLRLADDVRLTVAMKVDYGPQATSLFTVPADFAKTDLPPLGPLHDATISYRGERADTDQLQEDLFARNTTVSMAASRRLARFDSKGAADYLIVDDAMRRVTHLSPTQKAYRTERLANADRPALLFLYGWPLKIAGRAKFTRDSETTIAGLACTTWHVRDISDNPWFDVCVSDDGLVLRFAGTRTKDAAAIEAVDVLYGAPPASLFSVPADFQETK